MRWHAPGHFIYIAEFSSEVKDNIVLNRPAVNSHDLPDSYLIEVEIFDFHSFIGLAVSSFGYPLSN